MANEDLKAKLAALGVGEDELKGKQRPELQSMLDQLNLERAGTETEPGQDAEAGPDFPGDPGQDEDQDQDEAGSDAELVDELTRDLIAAVAKIGFRGEAKGLCRVNGGGWIKPGQTLKANPKDELLLDQATFRWLKSQALIK